MLKNGENCKILPVDIVDNFLIKNEGKSAVLPAALFPIVFEYNLLIFNPHLKSQTPKLSFRYSQRHIEAGILPGDDLDAVLARLQGKGDGACRAFPGIQLHQCGHFFVR